MDRSSPSVDVITVGEAAFARSLRDRLVSLNDRATDCHSATAAYLPATHPDDRLRRSSSLKTWKTPPGTPAHKKIVRFADALGLDLADVRTFLDEIPKVPSSAYVDLEECDPAPMPPPNPTLIPKFLQPVHSPDFLSRLNDLNVLLESATLTDSAAFTVSGTIRVRNLSYEKSVYVRYTHDRWTNFSDLRARYIPNSCDGPTDRFSFVLYAHTLRLGDALEFAIRYDSVLEFWDNNGGRNYVFECVPQSPGTWCDGDLMLTTTACEAPWTASFY